MLPLDGVRILSLEQYGAGPWATLHLADLGAEVIKVEDPNSGGDIGRYVPPYTSQQDSIYFQSFNRNKKSVAIDVGKSSGRDAFERLVLTADAVFNNLRGDVPAKLRIDYPGLRDIKPSVVCCSLTSFGRDNSRAAEPGYDYVMQAYAGWMWLTGEPDGPPTKTGLSLVDYAAGLLAALGTTAAVMRARATGEGCDVDVSLFDTAFSELSYVGAWYLSKGHVPVRHQHGSHPSQVPSQIFATRDGYVAVMCAKEKFWHRLCEAAECPELASDPRYATFGDRLANRDGLIQRLDAVFARKTTGEWIECLRGRVPCGPVNDLASAFADPLVKEHGLVIELDHPELGRIRELATAIRIGGAKPKHRIAPRLGEHTRDMLLEVGFDSTDVDRLRAEGSIA